MNNEVKLESTIQILINAYRKELEWSDRVHSMNRICGTVININWMIDHVWDKDILKPENTRGS